MPKSLTEQIIEDYIPKKKDTLEPNTMSPQAMAGFNICRTEMINKIPEILSLIKKEIEELNTDEYEIEDGVTSDKVVKLNDLLDLFDEK